jgi:hypothetical protein
VDPHDCMIHPTAYICFMPYLLCLLLLLQVHLAKGMTVNVFSISIVYVYNSAKVADIVGNGVIKLKPF